MTQRRQFLQAGLAAALALVRQGFEVTVLEQAPEIGEIGAGIQVSANAMHVMRHLGLEQSLLAIGVKPEAYVFRLHDTGEVIQRLDKKMPTIAVSIPPVKK